MDNFNFKTVRPIATSTARLSRKNFQLVSKIAGRQSAVCALELAAILACQEKFGAETHKCQQHLKDFEKCMRAENRSRGKGSSLLFHLSRITGSKP